MWQMRRPIGGASPRAERLSAVARAVNKRLRSPGRTRESLAEKRRSNGGDVPQEIREAAVVEYQKLSVGGKLPHGTASRLLARLSSWNASLPSICRWVCNRRESGERLGTLGAVVKPTRAGRGATNTTLTMELALMLVKLNAESHGRRRLGHD